MPKKQKKNLILFGAALSEIEIKYARSVEKLLRAKPLTSSLVAIYPLGGTKAMVSDYAFMTICTGDIGLRSSLLSGFNKEWEKMLSRRWKKGRGKSTTPRTLKAITKRLKNH